MGSPCLGSASSAYHRGFVRFSPTHGIPVAPGNMRGIRRRGARSQACMSELFFHRSSVYHTYMLSTVSYPGVLAQLVTSGLGHQQLGVRGICFDLLTQSVDVRFVRMGCDARVLAADFSAQ